MNLGRHAILDGWDVPADILNDRQRLKQWLRVACEAAGATVLDTMSHQFQPHGVTAVCLLAESHASIHTYPEHGRYMADVFTCGDIDPELAANVLRAKLGGTSAVRLIERPITTMEASNGRKAAGAVAPFDRDIPTSSR